MVVIDRGEEVIVIDRGEVVIVIDRDGDALMNARASERDWLAVRVR